MIPFLERKNKKEKPQPKKRRGKAKGKKKIVFDENTSGIVIRIVKQKNKKKTLIFGLQKYGFTSQIPL